MGLFIGVGWAWVCWGGVCQMGYASARLHCAVHCFLLLSFLFNGSCGKKSKLYMDSQGQERAFNMKHVGRVIKIDYLTWKQAQRNSCKHKNRAVPFCSLVAQLKRFYPHKEREAKQTFDILAVVIVFAQSQTDIKALNQLFLGEKTNEYGFDRDFGCSASS